MDELLIHRNRCSLSSATTKVFFVFFISLPLDTSNWSTSPGNARWHIAMQLNFWFTQMWNVDHWIYNSNRHATDHTRIRRANENLISRYRLVTACIKIWIYRITKVCDSPSTIDSRRTLFILISTFEKSDHIWNHVCLCCLFLFNTWNRLVVAETLLGNGFGNFKYWF